MVMELFCGTAGVSAAFKRNGFGNYIAIDKLIPRAPKASVTKLDLTLHVNQQLVLSWIRAGFIQAVFLAPPCGTASQARAIVLEEDPDAPVPLRSESQPDGLDGLNGLDLLRVTQANILYGFVADCWDLCCEYNVPCIVENPKNSLFWLVTCWRERQHSSRDILQSHQACGFGSSRPKWTTLCANFESVHSVNKVCPGNHKHAAWGLVRSGSKRRFATALEVHYPQALCEAIVAAFVMEFLRRGLTLPVAPSSNADAQAFSGVLPTSTQTQLFLPEYKCKVVGLYNSSSVQVWPTQTLSLDHAKLLTSDDVGDVKLTGQKLAEEVQIRCEAAKVSVDLSTISWNDVHGPLTLKIFGVYWSVDEFLEQAKQVKHPLSAERALPSILLQSLKDNINTSPSELARKRTEFVVKWTNRAKELEPEEIKLKASMDGQVAQAMKGKRLCLFREMLCHYNYPDVAVVDELQAGADLVGNVAATGMLPQKFQPALLTVEELGHRSELVRSTIMQQDGSSGDPQLDEQVWSKTMDEVAQGWLEGPLEEDSVSSRAPLSRRFGLIQKKDKVRLIDDYTESGVNSCVGTEESPTLHTIDVACAMLTAWFAERGNAGKESTLDARTFDLTSAYRQIGLSKQGRAFGHLRVYCPTSKRYKIFRSTVLPFGSIRSVHTFLRCARAIWWLGVVGCTSFYDDFICFTRRELSRCTELTVVSLFKVLGWLFAEEGDKCKPFDNTCSALGVLFSLADSHVGVARIHNTQKRIEELCADIDDIVRCGKLTCKAAQRLRGRMQFADAQVWGKAGKRCLRTLLDFACGYRSFLSDKDVFFLQCFRGSLVSDNPRLVKGPSVNNILIFIDACYEKDSEALVCGLGAVILLPFGDVRYFALALDEKQRQTLGEGKRKQIIFEAETLIAVLALYVWCDLLVDHKCIFFVDNEGCKFALLKGISDNACVDKLAELFVRKEDCLTVPLWLARVPSKSSLADDPSRFVFHKMLSLNAMNCSETAAAPLVQILTQIDDGCEGS